MKFGLYIIRILTNGCNRSLGIISMQKKNFGVGKTSDFPDPTYVFLTNGQSKLRSWVLLSSVRVAKKVPSPRSKNIRPKTSDLRPSYLFYMRYVSNPSTYVGFSTYILNFYLRPTVNKLFK